MAQKISVEEAEAFKGQLKTEIDSHWSEWDKNGNGVVDLEEAKPVLGPVMETAFGSKVTQDDLKAAFAACDTDKSSGLSKEELFSYCAKAIDSMCQ